MPGSVRSIAAVVSLVVLAGCAGAGSPTSTPAHVASPSITPGLASPMVSPTAGTPAAGPTTRPTDAPPTPDPTATEPAAATATPELGWREVAVAAGPSAREDHTWTLAGDGNSAYLFGGKADDGPSNELWRFDLLTNTWLPLVPAGEGPVARFGHAAQWVEGVGLVIWSGQAGSRFFADLWAYDPLADAWRQLPAQGDVPEARYGSCAGLGPDGRFWISHGFTADSGRFADTRAYDFATDMWADETPAGERPVERCLHDCLWAPDGRLVLYAGQTTGVPAIGDLWSYEPDAGSWTQAPEPPPEPRQLYALAALDQRAYVFGGGALNGELLDDLWQLDLADLSWTELEQNASRPPRRAGATPVADRADDRLLMFGGRGDDGPLADVWQLQLPTLGG